MSCSSHRDFESGRDEFQPARGHWDSKAISYRPDEPWPHTCPARDTGGFDAARYSCFLHTHNIAVRQVVSACLIAATEGSSCSTWAFLL